MKKRSAFAPGARRVTVAIATIAGLMGLMPSSAHAKPGQQSGVFTAPYSRGNPGTVTDCFAGADVCSATATGGAAGIFDVASEVTRNDPTAEGELDIAYGFANASQSIKVPKGAAQVTVTMSFHATDMKTSAGASRGRASAALLVFADARSDYCTSESECTATQGSATLARSSDSGGLPSPSDGVGPDAAVTLTITAPAGSALPTRPLFVIGSAVSISSLANEPSCLTCVALGGRAGSASSSARISLDQMRVTFP